MTAKDYRAALDRLGLSQVGAASLFGVNPRTSRRWALGEQDIPRAVEIAITLMLRTRHLEDLLRHVDHYYNDVLGSDITAKIEAALERH